MNLSFSELKKSAKDAADMCYPKNLAKTGAALLCRDGSIETGFEVCFSDGHKISAIDMALSHALSFNKEKFLALAVFTKGELSKNSLKRLGAFGDMMVYLTDGENEIQSTLKKLI